VTDFIYRLALWNNHFAISPSLSLKEKADFIRGVDEVLTEPMLGVACSCIEDSNAFRSGLKVINKPVYFLYCSIAFLRRDEVLNNCVTVLM
jgi:hypothetical protein